MRTLKTYLDRQVQLRIRWAEHVALLEKQNSGGEIL